MCRRTSSSSRYNVPSHPIPSHPPALVWLGIEPTRGWQGFQSSAKSPEVAPKPRTIRTGVVGERGGTFLRRKSFANPESLVRGEFQQQRTKIPSVRRTQYAVTTIGRSKGYGRVAYGCGVKVGVFFFELVCVCGCVLKVSPLRRAPRNGHLCEYMRPQLNSPIIRLPVAPPPAPHTPIHQLRIPTGQRRPAGL